MDPLALILIVMFIPQSTVDAKLHGRDEALVPERRQDWRQAIQMKDGAGAAALSGATASFPTTLTKSDNMEVPAGHRAKLAESRIK